MGTSCFFRPEERGTSAAQFYRQWEKMVLSRDFDAEFDVVVAGGGSAGCVLATRLTENPSTTLCLIEAGGRDRNPWIHIPLGFGKLVPNPSVNWGAMRRNPCRSNGRRLSWPRGKVLGGSGSINGLVFLRGAPSDYDSWEALGAKGWAYKDVLPYFKRMEHNVRGADAYRGQGGPMTISDIKKPSANAKAFVEACAQLQHPLNPDFNGERIDGVGMVQLNVRNGWRCSTAAGYLKPNLKRTNLKLMTRTQVPPRPVRWKASGRRRGRGGRHRQAHPRSARGDRIGRLDQLSGPAHELRRRAGCRFESGRDRRCVTTCRAWARTFRITCKPGSRSSRDRRER